MIPFCDVRFPTFHRILKFWAPSSIMVYGSCLETTVIQIQRILELADKRSLVFAIDSIRGNPV